MGQLKFEVRTCITSYVLWAVLFVFLFGLCVLEYFVEHLIPRWHIKKQRQYFPKKVHVIKAVVFPVVMYGCENWTLKKAERQRIDAFELWCWRRLLRVPWTARRSNQLILKEIGPEYSLE